MTKIEWTKRPGTIGESWNFLAGCTKVSEGCTNCYSLSMSWRIQNNPKRPERYEGVVEKRGILNIVTADDTLKAYNELHWTGRVNLDYDALEIPYRWKKPRTVFVASMTDLFHEKVTLDFLNKVFNVMEDCPQHTFLILTKRAKRMMLLLKARGNWPLPNVWLLVTAENQEMADLRIPYLLRTPAAVRGVSVEPMLGPISNAYDYCVGLPTYAKGPLDWIIIGAESGPNRRTIGNGYIADLIEQCDAANVPVFVKQIHRYPNHRVSKDMAEWPVELRRREWPK